MSFSDCVMNESVVVIKDGYKRIWCGEYPLGRRIQTKAERCTIGTHKWFIEEYEGITKPYVDKVCSRCRRRKPLN